MPPRAAPAGLTDSAAVVRRVSGRVADAGDLESLEACGLPRRERRKRKSDKISDDSRIE